MKIKITEVTQFIIEGLQKLGFSEEEAKYCADNILEGEMTDKKTHGLIRMKYLKNAVEKGEIEVKGKDINIAKETAVSLLIDGQRKTGLYVVAKALEKGMEKVKESGLLLVGVTNTAPISGLIGNFARKACEQNLIYIGFNNSSEA
jgi:LDH2 family malate/lactate/ureidoglycolate dehydrogenase